MAKAAKSGASAKVTAAAAEKPAAAGATRVTIIGGGMITKIQLLPTIYHLQREGIVGEIRIYALKRRRCWTCRTTRRSPRRSPASRSRRYPDPAKVAPGEMFPEPLQGSAGRRAQGQHRGGGRAGPVPLRRGHGRPGERPARLRGQAAGAQARAGRGDRPQGRTSKGLVVGVEYHKRFDYPQFHGPQGLPRRAVRRVPPRPGPPARVLVLPPLQFPELVTCENSDMFTYIGCHYVDLVAFITGLRPAAVSVYGMKDKYPNGNEGYLWTDGRVIWENGACLSVANVTRLSRRGRRRQQPGHDHVVRGRQGRLPDLPQRPVPRREAQLHGRQRRPRRHRLRRAQPRLLPACWTRAAGAWCRSATGFRSVEYIVGACKQVAGTADLAARQQAARGSTTPKASWPRPSTAVTTSWSWRPGERAYCPAGAR